jgi:hypothetical protein
VSDERLEVPPAGHRAIAARPQFSLKAMFGVVAAVGILLAAMSAIGPLWSVLLAWFLVMASAHVFANVWGSKHAGRHYPRHETSAAAIALSRQSFAPSTSLRKQAYQGKLMLFSAGAGACIGACLGLFIFHELQRDVVGPGGLMVATFSSAVVGGFAGFLAISFASVALGAISEASHDTAHPSKVGPD